MDRLRAIAAFVRVADLGTLSSAARSLSSTQPTISKQIASLEQTLGVRLLQRGPARVVLTEEGARFLESARELLDGYEGAVADLAQGTREAVGRVRIAAPVALGELRLNALMLRALELHPRLDIDLILEDRFVDPVEERFDLAVRIGSNLPQDLVARKLAVWPRYILASPDYVRRQGLPRRPEDLARHLFLRYPTGPDDSTVLDGPGGSVAIALNTRYRINSAVALLSAVVGGTGIAFQPCWMVRDHLQQGTLVRLLPRWTGPAQTAYLVYPPRRSHPKRVQVMLDLLTREIGSL